VEIIDLLSSASMTRRRRRRRRTRRRRRRRWRRSRRRRRGRRRGRRRAIGIRTGVRLPPKMETQCPGFARLLCSRCVMLTLINYHLFLRVIVLDAWGGIWDGLCTSPANFSWPVAVASSPYSGPHREEEGKSQRSPWLLGLLVVSGLRTKWTGITASGRPTNTQTPST
jgi:hypothetical protein